ncbi:four helix bundle protein [Desulfuromusa kysingii]|uniref:Four helix bundle protein n=1 Tax=Desulfuromusa kysingii TaxID=37625 RepID=A0A1H3YH03_9BACT|nr:four helix bundle protein [Desulfuromusa kysingii]SEA10817.1 four helix bundle protein [Desulfuromusa kysingii]
MSDYKELVVWQMSMELAEHVYLLTRSFPKEELYGLTSQIRRSVVSIPSNIAEGSSRGGRKDFIQFLMIARGSAAELETQIMLALKIDYVSDIDKIINQITSIRQMINALIRSLRNIEGRK